jgi:hypothetical protein
MVLTDKAPGAETEKTRVIKKELGNYPSSFF